MRLCNILLQPIQFHYKINPRFTTKRKGKEFKVEHAFYNLNKVNTIFFFLSSLFFYFFLFSSFFFGFFLCLIRSKWSILSHTKMEGAEASSYRLTAVRGSHYGWTVVLAGTEFFCSSLAPRA